MSSDQNTLQNLTYSQSGVNIDAGNELVERIKPAVRKTFRDGVLTGLGGFGALFEIPVANYRNPVLVSGTDGVGTKLKLANMLNKHGTIGIDLVAMCVNDVLVCGAEPLYFLDYFATGKLEIDQAEIVIKGIAKGCEIAGCALIGGETAEMPGMYDSGDYDLAGFAVGIVEKEEIISTKNVSVGDIVLGLGSSGPHSNGYSLIRKILELSTPDLNEEISGVPLGELLIEPTRIYVKSVLSLLQSSRVSAISHITGGGILENLPRVLPAGTGAKISSSSWQFPPIFNWLQEQGKIERSEMLRTFNCGIGMIICIPEKSADTALDHLLQSGETVYVLGEIISSNGPAVEISG